MRLGRQRLDVARLRVVALVAMQVERQAAPLRQPRQHLNAFRALPHRALEMRNAADDVDAEIERPGQVGDPARRTEIAVLREGDELQVEIGFDLSLYRQQRLDG